MKTSTGIRIRPATVLAILRIMTALLFLEHGTMKLFHFPAAPPFVSEPMPTLILVAALLELVGGILIALGLFTRPSALLCSGEMAFGYFMAHGSREFWPALNGGDAAILFCFVFLYLAAAGGGDWSLDRLRTARQVEDKSDLLSN